MKAGYGDVNVATGILILYRGSSWYKTCCRQYTL